LKAGRAFREAPTARPVSKRESGEFFEQPTIGSNVVDVCAHGPAKYDPVRCRRCGHLTRRSMLGTERYQRRSLRGIRHIAPENCYPDEYVVACPDCGACESFDDAPHCAECLEYPCICTANET